MVTILLQPAPSEQAIPPDHANDEPTLSTLEATMGCGSGGGVAYYLTNLEDIIEQPTLSRPCHPSEWASACPIRAVAWHRMLGCSCGKRGGGALPQARSLKHRPLPHARRLMLSSHNSLSCSQLLSHIRVDDEVHRVVYSIRFLTRAIHTLVYRASTNCRSRTMDFASLVVVR